MSYGRVIIFTVQIGAAQDEARCVFENSRRELSQPDLPRWNPENECCTQEQRAYGKGMGIHGKAQPGQDTSEEWLRMAA